MLRVKNRKTIQKLAKSSFSANKMRNIFAVVAIMLTTLLFTGLFTVASSLISSMEESTMRQVGSSAHGSFKGLTKEQYDILKTHSTIQNITYSVALGIGENKELEKRPTEIRYSNDALHAEGTFSMPTTGRLPEKDDELATDTIVLEKLGIPPVIGEKIPLEYSINGEKRTELFTLVGLWEGDPLMMASMVYLNRSYVERQLEGFVSADDNNIFGTIMADVNFSNSRGTEEKLIKVIRDSGYTTDEIAYGANWAYMGNGDTDIGTILGGAITILMIVFCGYLMISNVFYISVAKDIRYYGLLKTIGTTEKQIKRLIRFQALLLCMVGIPLGLLAGYIVGSILTPVVLSIINTNVIKITFSPLFLLLSMFFAVITVVISVSKPSRLAAKVSPIEALRSADTTHKTKKGTKRSSGFILFQMAISNVFRNGKKATLVTISLSLSLVILNGTYSIANSFDMDKYLKGRIGSDFAVADVSHFNVHLDYTDQDTLNQDFLENLRSKDGIEAMDNIYFAEPWMNVDTNLKEIVGKVERELTIEPSLLEMIKDSVEQGKLLPHIYGIDDGIFQKLEVFSGEIDLDKLKTGDYVIVGPYDAKGRVNYYNVGDKVNLPSIMSTE